MKRLSERKLEKVTVPTVWKEVLCEDSSIYLEVLMEVQEELKLLNYYISEDLEDDLGPITRKALVQFQKENGLPVGQLDFDTLDFLKIIY